MKTIFHHPSEPAGGKKYWRSLDELADTADFQAVLEREFPRGAAEFNDNGDDGLSRRSFIKLMGASTALAGLGLSGCHRPVMNLVPFTKSVEWAIPGKPLFFATSMPGRRGALPLVVTTHDGRPTKVDGNPLHGLTKGASDVFAQASILNLYDPERSRYFLIHGQASDATHFEKSLDRISANLATNGGAGLAFLVEQNNSPTRERLRAEVLKKFPQATWCVYEPLGNDEAAKMLEAGGTRSVPDISKADVILSLDCDFLGCEDGGVHTSRAFADRREPDPKLNPVMNRLYVVENRYTITGGVADHRLRCPASQVAAFTLALAKEIAKLTGNASLDPFNGANDKPRVNASFVEGWLEKTAEDLVNAKGRGLVLAGARQPAAVHLLVQSINDALGNLGATVTGAPVTEKPGITIAELARNIADKKVTSLFILGGNPVYNAPADLEWLKLQKTIPVTVRLGMYADETSAASSWHVPAAHYLEAWGDGRAADGSYLSGQPMILPLFDGWSELDILARLAGLPKPTGAELIQETFRSIAKPTDFDAEWNKFLHDGFLSNSAVPPTPIQTADNSAWLRDNANLPVIEGGDAYEVVFTSSASVDDGRYANNGWLQELPDPITKLTWDNAALISPATAKKLGIPEKEFGQKDFQVIEVALDSNRKIQIPALIAPGHADHSVSIPLGYGRTVTGWVGAHAGVNAYPLRTTAQPYFAVGAKITLVEGVTSSLAITQDHNNMEGRALVREGTISHYKEKPDFAKKMWMDAELPVKNPTLYTHPPMTGLNQWGMVIDLNKCTGCNACVVACQAENNIPIVGKEQVIHGREMHWIRNDRYFASWDDQDDDPEMVMEPMLCQQCENAPCETVCPVNATVHSDEGLNVMAYNRCIGTRYCSNNCPFKVRRFNFFDYQQRPVAPQKVPLFGEVSGLKLGSLTEKGSPDTLKMQKNPNVTVRMRGIMEKCTFCVQRIEEAKIAQRVKAGPSPDVRVPADAFKVACQQACPAEAIVFGDILEDSGSKVSKLKKDPRGYRLLDYLNVNSRITYLAKIRNPNMKMPGADKVATFDASQEEKPKEEQTNTEPKGAS